MNLQKRILLTEIYLEFTEFIFKVVLGGGVDETPISV